MRTSNILLAILIACVAFGCSKDSIPKPRGYFRINLPEKNFESYSGSCPFTLEVPKYSRIEIIENHDSQDSCWFNIAFPQFKARIHCTYLPVNSNFDDLMRDSYEYAFKHEVKASAIDRIIVSDDSSKVYGIIYDIKGDVASQLQFFLTDSSDHFLRGSLYFENRPNADSLAPVVSYLKDDIFHMAESLEWQ